ncbi:hypothetical protein P872_09705 [Rhodonellum psychrophilum GCM71 = DSM 17998]|uniref:Uncharacterized protein n=1 Tax=Rhodonellum psychrophilum GCM71 = DSM 17998 TaxID=1123057 RepID=U5BY37_9BACT|nr:hypothetical protein P872_09705 [Rhodonellum psychrophilum GCM71 = DSM 17998]
MLEVLKFLNALGKCFIFLEGIGRDPKIGG